MIRVPPASLRNHDPPRQPPDIRPERPGRRCRLPARDARGDGRPGMGSPRCHPRHGRRLHRQPLHRGGRRRTPAGEGRLPRGHYRPARRPLRRRYRAPRRAGAILGRFRRERRFHGRQLHRPGETPPDRRFHSRRPERPAPRPRRHRVRQPDPLALQADKADRPGRH